MLVICGVKELVTAPLAVIAGPGCYCGRRRARHSALRKYMLNEPIVLTRHALVAIILIFQGSFETSPVTAHKITPHLVNMAGRVT